MSQEADSPVSFNPSDPKVSTMRCCAVGLYRVSDISGCACRLERVDWLIRVSFSVLASQLDDEKSKTYSLSNVEREELEKARTVLTVLN